MRLVLFDIDGTLLWTDGAGRRAIQRALLDEAGTAGPIERYRFDGKTDPQIVRELLSLAGHAAAGEDTRVAAVCRRYVAHLRAELAKPTQTTKLMPGVAELLAALQPLEAAGRALVGLLTGNLAVGAAGRGGRELRVRDARRRARGARRDPRVSADRGTPADELELKARIEDPEALRGALTHAGATLEFRGDMIDRRFDRDGALSRRDEVLRLRVFRPAVDAAGSTYGMLGWKGPNSRRDGYRHRAEAEARGADPETVVTIPERPGFTVSP